MRPPGMGWFRMPLFLWALYATAIIQILATPVLGITVLLLIVERVFEIGIFDPGWAATRSCSSTSSGSTRHPAVYIMILPAMGIISELISIHSRKPHLRLRVHRLRQHRDRPPQLPRLGPPHVRERPVRAREHDLQPADVQRDDPVGGQGLQLAGDDVQGVDLAARRPCCYALAFIFLFGIGGLTGLFLGTLATDVHLHDTYFVVAHFHYVMMGSTLIAFIGGLHHWWPKIFGRMYSETGAQSAASWFVFVGFNLTFFPQFVMGARGMPRRYFNYEPEFASYHVMSSIGSFLLGVAMIVVAANLIHSLLRGKKASGNPWGGASFEWLTASPPIHENFETVPKPAEDYDPYDFTNMTYDEKRAT
jgi:cytochrome c oxidase subunit 1